MYTCKQVRTHKHTGKLCVFTLSILLNNQKFTVSTDNNNIDVFFDDNIDRIENSELTD